MSDKNKKEASLKKHNVTTATVFFMIFCMVCAGAYGIEDMIPVSGPGLTLVLLMVLPFFWSIPQGLVAAELGSAIPEEGGYYKWIQRALGEFWGFQAGWWRTLSIYVDSTLYVVLLVGYMRAFVDMADWQALMVKVLVILVFTYVNLRGLKDVGAVTTFFSLLVMASFVFLIILGFANWQFNPFLPFTPPGQSVGESLGLGIAIAMWMYAGYESMSTMAGECTNPQVIPKATILSVPAIMLMYILATMSGLAAIGHWQQWSTAGGISFGTIANHFGIPIFGVIFGIAAVASNASIYNAYLTSGSRGFYAMAEDKLMPRFFADIHPKYGTPYKAIISMAVVNLILCQYGFEVLVVIDIFLLMFAYVLIYIAAVVLRVKEPDLPRPFRIPLGTKGVLIMCIPPVLLAALALFSNGLLYLVGGCLGVLSGPIAYYFLKRKYGGDRQEPALSRRSRLANGVLCAVMLVLVAGGATMLLQERGQARAALKDFGDSYVAQGEQGEIRFDWGEELYYLALNAPDSEAEVAVYYDAGDFFGSVVYDRRFEQGEDFAQAAWDQLQRLSGAGLPLAWVDFASDNYVAYETEPGAYGSAGELLDAVGQAF